MNIGYRFSIGIGIRIANRSIAAGQAGRREKKNKVHLMGEKQLRD